VKKLPLHKSIIILLTIFASNVSTMIKRLKFRNLLWVSILAVLPALTIAASSRFIVLAQASSPTPTMGTSEGMFITVISAEPQINVRGGPSSVAYPIVGFLIQGATAPALGRSPGGDWIQIEYGAAPGGVGWVYSALVSVSPGTLRIIEPPPTPIPPATSTIDPTLAAQFNSVPTGTRLPTFTPPPVSQVAPHFTETPRSDIDSGIPMGMMILAFASIGSIGFLMSMVGRR
jgi:hypothetical protein